MKLLGIDTGGTFTDFVYFDQTGVRVHKVLSTPESPERAILQGMAEMGLTDTPLVIIHGSTVATNAVLEDKGVRTAYITNRGMTDILTIGRQSRSQLYALQPDKPQPPVPESLCLPVDSRLGADGNQLSAPTDKELAALKKQLEALAPDAVAINLLFSFLDDSDEKRIEAIVPEQIFCSRSSHILPVIKEYERGIATWLNAYVGPLMQGYIHRLEQAANESRLSIMQSHGGTIRATEAGRNAVRLLLSGPAGGLQGARYIAEQSGIDRLLTFDMGGTSTDVALIDGEIRLTSEGQIENYPVAVPMVDMHTIGAGGGSIAWLDEGGMLQVGPESAGASPGPACYGQGGSRATVTDANLYLGRLPRKTRLGGGKPVQPELARRAIETLAQEMKCSPEETALGIIQIANDHMAQALRVISVQRGLDPNDYTLVSFGGAGGLHVCELAEMMGMKAALIPMHGGVLSALGMLVAPASRELTQSHLRLLADCRDAEIQSTFEEMIRNALDDLRQDTDGDIQVTQSLELRYQGQSSTLSIPWTSLDDTSRDFHLAHEQRFGHRLDISLELVNLNVSLSGAPRALNIHRQAGDTDAVPGSYEQLAGCHHEVPVFERKALATGQRIRGPALIAEKVSTSFIAPGWQCIVDISGSLKLTSV
jgi:N-methylhydantoinase A